MLFPFPEPFTHVIYKGTRNCGIILSMKKRMKILKNFILAAGVAVLTAICRPITAEASTISGVQNNIDSINAQIDSLKQQIADLESEQSLIQEEIDDLNSEIINTMTSIGMLEEQIAEKEQEIKDKQAQIEATEAEYEAALKREEDQRASMVAQARLLYENGEYSYLNVLLKGGGISDILNSMDYIEKVYEYNKKMLDDYIETKELVLELWNQLEQEKAELEQDMQQLEADEEDLKIQNAELNAMLARKKQQSANYEAEIDRARQEAAVNQTRLKQEEKKLKELQAALAAQAAQAAQNKQPGSSAASSGTTTTTTPNITTTDYTSIINGSSGSDQGKKIANYACQYVGNPYVSGGTSLTSGADCSGFTYRVYADFGYSLPRTSSQQRGAGTGVSYEEAQPGDLICYDGHVALYIGGGLIVHASSSSPYPVGGIKIGNAQDKTILAVRRIV